MGFEIDLILDNYIREIREKSMWGKKQTEKDYIRYIIDEKKELECAIKLGDRTNIIEEISDVYMMICFYYQEVIDNNILSYNSIACEWKNIIEMLEVYDITQNCIIKLTNRYSTLFPRQLNFFSYFSNNEELLWNKYKSYNSMMEFSYCQNEKCINKNIFFNGENLYIDSNNINGNNILHIRCKYCGRIIPLKKGVIFYGINLDYKIILKSVVDYIVRKDTDVFKRYNINYIQFNIIKKRCADHYYIIKQIVKDRYNINLDHYNGLNKLIAMNRLNDSNE